MKFSIRDLLWLTVVVGLGVAWWLHHRAWVEKYSAETVESQTWQARAEEIQVRAEWMAEQLRGMPKFSPKLPNE